MNHKVEAVTQQLLRDIPALEGCRDDLLAAFRLLKDSFASGNKLLLCGNGGSAADCEHIVGELMKGFLLKRDVTEQENAKILRAFPQAGGYLSARLQRALPAISLVNATALSTAYANDVAPDMVFAQQVFGYGKKGDTLLAISTSGNSANVLNAVKIARAFEVKTIGFTGSEGGNMKTLCDVVVRAPASATYRVQEYHLPLYHALCAMLEAEFFG